MSAGRYESQPAADRAADAVLQLLQRQHPRPMPLWRILTPQRYDHARPAADGMSQPAELIRSIDRACESLAQGLVQPEGRNAAARLRGLAHSAMELGAALDLLRDVAVAAEGQAALQSSAPAIGVMSLQARGAVRVRHGCVYLTGRNLSGATPAAPAAGQ